MTDKINPDHYKSQCSIECIEAMEIAFGDEGVLAFCLCNAFKYLWRCKYKGGYEDVLKAEWYVKHADDLYEQSFDTERFGHQLFTLRDMVDKYKKIYGGK